MTQWNLGMINENVMEVEYAIESYTFARLYSPDIQDIHFRLGMLLYKTGELKNALDPLR